MVEWFKKERRLYFISKLVISSKKQKDVYKMSVIFNNALDLEGKIYMPQASVA